MHNVFNYMTLCKCVENWRDLSKPYDHWCPYATSIHFPPVPVRAAFKLPYSFADCRTSAPCTKTENIQKNWWTENREGSYVFLKKKISWNVFEMKGILRNFDAWIAWNNWKFALFILLCKSQICANCIFPEPRVNVLENRISPLHVVRNFNEALSWKCTSFWQELNMASRKMKKFNNVNIPSPWGLAGAAFSLQVILTSGKRTATCVVCI